MKYYARNLVFDMNLIKNCIIMDTSVYIKINSKCVWVFSVQWKIKWNTWNFSHIVRKSINIGNILYYILCNQINLYIFELKNVFKKFFLQLFWLLFFQQIRRFKIWTQFLHMYWIAAYSGTTRFRKTIKASEYSKSYGF